VLAQHILAIACAGPFAEAELLAEIQSAAPYAGLTPERFAEILNYIATGGYALKAYDKFRRLVREGPGRWRITRPAVAFQHRLNAGVIVEQPMMDVRFRGGRKLGRIEEGFASTLAPGITSSSPASASKSSVSRTPTSSSRPRPSRRGSSPTAASACPCRPTSPNASVASSPTAANGRASPDDVREWLEVQAYRSLLPEPDQLLVETFPHEKLHFMVMYSFEGWNAHQSLGMLITRRMETAGLKPLGFVANDYALAIYGLEPVTDPKPLLSPDILEHEFVEWVEQSNLLKRAFREVAVIGGLVERQHPGRRKTGRQVSFSTDLIYDVLRRYEPDHLLMRAAWDDARARMTELGRLARLVDRAAATMIHVDVDRITPMAVPLMVIVGREGLPPGSADETLLFEAETLAAQAMQKV
jgi:ATP-dependent Lhr-like helicase